MTQTNIEEPERDRLAKIAFGCMSMACLTVGMVLYLFAEDFGLDVGMARFIAIAFIAAGVSDYIMLRFWDRMKKKR